MRAMQLHTRAGEMAHRLGDRSVEGLALANVGFAYGIVGLFGEARRKLETSMQMLKLAGDLTHLRTATRAYYLILAVTGDVAAAQPGLERALAEFTAASDQFERAFCLATLAFIDAQKNNWDSAVQRFLQSRDIFAGIKFQAGMAQAEAQLALCHLRLGRLSEANGYAEKVWSYLQAPGAFDAHVFGNKYLICAEVFQVTGEHDKARAAIEAGYREMMAFADKLTDPEWRTSYLEHLPDNVTLAARWRAIHPDAATVR
jgi:tetratricopeptide (TPR) repeat protein